jgi:hypothetical protein
MIAQTFTLSEYAIAGWLALALTLLVLHALVDLSRLFTRLMNRTPTVNVDADVQAVITESLHVHRDPLAPDARYGAFNEARERLRRRR